MKLLPFASSSSTAEIQMEAQIEMQTKGFLLTFEMSGKGVSEIVLPAKSEKASRKNELWKETCFECFFGVARSKAYFEFNGSPSGNWAFYSFDDYRNGMKDWSLLAGDSPVMMKL